MGSSLWETLSSLLGHGTADHMPSSFSTRMLTCIWWMFTLLMISCYTANLSAFLTIQRMEVGFSKPEDLYQSKISFGVLNIGTTSNYLKVSYG